MRLKVDTIEISLIRYRLPHFRPSESLSFPGSDAIASGCCGESSVQNLSAFYHNSSPEY